MEPSLLPGALRAVWTRRREVLLIHVAAVLARAAVGAPLAALVVQASVGLSGQAALTDHDIARFALSPAGVLAMLLFGGAALALLTLELAAMIALARARAGGLAAVLGARRAALLGAPRAFRLGVAVTLRVLLTAAPFLLAGAAVAWRVLDGRDPYVVMAEAGADWRLLLALGGALGLGLLAALAVRLARWSLALPVLMARGCGATAALAESVALTRGRRGAVARDLALWAMLFLGLGAGLALLAAALAGWVAPGPDASVRTVTRYLIAALTLWSIANALLSGLGLGALASLLAAWTAKAGGPAPAVEAAPQDRPRTPPSPVRVGLAALALAAMAAVAATGTAGALGARAAAPDATRVIAHRGAAAHAPENTLAAIRRAIADGADAVEIDVQETADGAVVVLHDADFGRVGGVALRVSDATLAQVAAIDVGGGERAPTLAQALEAARGRVEVLIELKHYGRAVRLEDRVARIVEAAGMAEAVAVMSLDAASVARMRALRPGWRVGLLAAAAVGDLTRADADFLAVNAATATPGFIDRAAAADRPVLVWTVNAPAAASRFISRGAAGLITDDPAMVRAVLAERAAMGAGERLLAEAAAFLGVAGSR